MELPADFSLEEKLTELRRLVEKMQQGVSDFDRQVELFRQGMELIGQCRGYLDQAELRVQQLVNGELKPLE
ncbi:MAG: exodeoxyribonuclease VII small subunit [Bacteroidia bacterium]|nr:exodeoxyribonuclease VII small subunit [Bacteroidia bacterium]